jgi:hypothetical protein
MDFDYRQSRTAEAYYIDNNSRPAVGAHLSSTISGRNASFTLGASGMTGTYDPDNELRFQLVGAHAVLGYRGAFLRAEYLARRTEMALGENPAERFRYGPGMDGAFDAYSLKEGFYVETEVPAGRLGFVLRADGMRRRGNVLESSDLRSDSAVLRYTAAATIRLREALRLKLSGERYDFSDFEDEVVFHLGIAGPF